MEQGDGVNLFPRAEPKVDKRTEKVKATASSGGKGDSSLHVEDLDNPSLSPVPHSHSSVDE